MSEYINKSIINNKLIPLYKELSFIHPKQAKGVMMAIKKLEEQPTAKVEVVRHGKWIKGTSKGIWFCSECTRHIEDRTNEPNKNFPYCHCGAKMDGESE